MGLSPVLMGRERCRAAVDRECHNVATFALPALPVRVEALRQSLACSGCEVWGQDGIWVQSTIPGSRSPGANISP